MLSWSSPSSWYQVCFRWTKQFSRTRDIHFAFFIIQFVSDNQLVISNSTRALITWLPGWLQPSCCRINLSCPPHYGDRRGVRDSSRWNTYRKEDQLPVSSSHLQHHGQLIKECIGKCCGWIVYKEDGDLLFELKARRTRVCRTFYTFQNTFSHSHVWGRLLEMTISLFTELAAMLQERIPELWVRSTRSSDVYCYQPIC